MSEQVKTRVLVACPKGTAHKRLVRLRRYEWSDAEGAFVRVDSEGEESYIRKVGNGLEWYARPHFQCPIDGCLRSAECEHDKFQEMLRRAASTDGVILI